MSKILKLFLLGIALAGLCVAGCSEKATTGTGVKPKPTPEPDPDVEEYDLITFPDRKDPKTVGEGVVDLFIRSGNSNWGDMHSSKKSSLTSYPDICAWLGAFWYAEAAGNNGLFDQLVAKFDQFLEVDDKSIEPNKSLVTQIPRTENNAVDYNIFGAVPLHIYYVKKQRGAAEADIKKYLDLGLRYADQQWELPTEKKYLEKMKDPQYYHNLGYSYQTRLWIDDMFMITDLQAQAYLVTGDKKYIDRAAREMALYLDRIQRPNGLFYHHTGTPFFWGRGDGWMAVGMAEMLRMLPKDNPYLPRIKAAYLQMMETLLRYQAYDGMWRQIIDDPNSWKETSSTAMFTYAMILGVKNGWLDEKTYGTVARKGWLGLQSYLQTNFEIRNVCCGTGAGTSYAYYRDREKYTGDLHGQAAVMWCAYALTELANERK